MKPVQEIGVAHDNGTFMIDEQATFPPEILDTEYLEESHILNLLPVGIYICDASGKTTGYNKKAMELWGSTPQTGKGEPFSGMLKFYDTAGKYLPYSNTPAAICIKDGVSHKDIELIAERPDMSKMVLKLSVTPIKKDNGTVIGAVSCFEDITVQKDIQKALERKTLELEDYVVNAPVGLHWINENGIIIWANKAELDMLGYTPEEYIGHHISEFHIAREKINDMLERLEGDETLRSYESIMRCKDGSLRMVQVSSNVFREHGRFIHTRCFTIDVTEQQKLHQTLQESEARYRDLVNSIPAGVYTCDPSGKITFFNEAAVALWGYRPDVQDDSLRFCACYKVWLMDGTYTRPHETPMATALQTGQAFRNVEALVERPDGTSFYAAVNIEPLHDKDHKLTGAINIFQDITATKQTEMALRESEAKYKELIQTLDTPLYTTDAEGRITLYNKAAVALWGREPEIGKDLWCGSYKILRSDGSELPMESCPIAVCLRTHQPATGEEIIIVRPDGSHRNVIPHPQPLFDASGSLTGAINMLIDVTSIRLAEKRIAESEQNYRALAATLEKRIKEKTKDLEFKNEALRQSEERYHRMVEQVEDYAIILLDKKGHILNWNKGAQKIKGYTEEEIVGKHFEIFYPSEERANGIPKKIIQEASKNGKASIEGWRLRKDGSRFWGSIVMTALHNDHGDIIGFTKVTRDLTERKMSEDRLREYSNELEFRNKELEQFAYAASHDMKEPLRKINVYGAYIKDNKANKLDSRSMDFLERSLNAANRMGKLIDDLLAYSRTTSSTEAFAVADMNKIVHEVVSDYRDEIAQKHIKVSIGQLPVVEGIPFQLKQLMFNLIGNAIKYSDPSKQSTITIGAKVIQSSKNDGLNLSAGKKYYCISVEDNGVGFEQQYAGRIFEIFQRLENRQEIKGSGIGLAICKKIAQNHKGSITATGHLKQGARFDVYLPVRAD